MDNISLYLFGAPHLEADGVGVQVPRRKALALLAYLTGTERAHSRDSLAALLWPEWDATSARTALRRVLVTAKKAAGNGNLLVEQDRIGLPADGGLWVDVQRFRWALARNRAHSHSHLHQCDACLGWLTEAAELYRDDFLAGFSLADAPEFDDWQAFETASLRRDAGEVLEKLVSIHAAPRDFAQAIHCARRWLALDPLHEAAHQMLMRLYAWAGEQTSALRQYRECADLLQRELGVPPQAETTELYERVKAGLVVLDGPPAAASLASPHPVIRSNLPAPTLPLIGREKELAALDPLLKNPAHRLVTILGPGGMGKSRLALAAGHAAVDHFAGGVFLVELVALRSAEEIARAIGDSLDYPFQSDPRPPRQQVLDFLRCSDLLLILDNFEHLLDGAEFLVELLQTAPGVRLLVTSRERLRLQAETIFRLDGLAFPTQKAEIQTGAEPYGAIELFLQSAQRLRLDYTVGGNDWPAIARICRLVDGMPLGILLAASWSDMLSPQAIAEEIGRGVDLLQADLGDLALRHRNIAAVFEQSWQRLSVQEQQGLMALSIFTGGFEREAAQTIAGASLAILTRLVDRSLLWRVGEGRYDLHELVRQLARQKLAHGGQEEAVRTLHSRWFLGLVSRQEPRLKGAEETQAIELMVRERENVRAAWIWATQHRQIDLLQQAIEALGIFHNRPGQWQAGEALIRPISEMLESAATPQEWLLHAWLSAWHGLFLHWTGQGSLARAHLTDLLESLKNLAPAGVDLRPVQAFAYLHRGGGLMTDHHWGETEVGFRQALALYEELGEVWWKTRCLIDLGHMQIFEGDVRKAYRNTEMARNLASVNGDTFGEIQALRRMGLAMEQIGRPEEAEVLVRQAFALLRNNDERQEFGNHLAFVLLAVGKFDEAAAILQEGIDWMNSMGFDPVQLPFGYNNLARACLHLGRFDEARTLAQESLRRWTDAHGWRHPYIVRTMARAVYALGDTTAARHLLHRSIKDQQEVRNKNLFELSRAFTECVLPALSLNDLAEARQMLAEGLRLVQRGEAFTCTCLALPAAALLLAQEQRLQEAADIYGAIQRYPRLTSSRWYATVALDRLKQLLAPLPPDVRAAAEEQGSQRTLESITGVLLEMLMR